MKVRVNNTLAKADKSLLKAESENFFNVKELKFKIPIYLVIIRHGASLVAQTVKNLPPPWDTLFRSLGWEDPLEKEMATTSSILAWKIPWTEEPGRATSHGVANSWT